MLVHPSTVPGIEWWCGGVLPDGFELHPYLLVVAERKPTTQGVGGRVLPCLCACRMHPDVANAQPWHDDTNAVTCAYQSVSTMLEANQISLYHVGLSAPMFAVQSAPLPATA